MYKCKINSIFEQLNYEDYKILKKILPQILGVSLNTAINYRQIKLDDLQDIPYELGKKLEIMFGLEGEGISNKTITCKSYRDLIKEEKERIAEKKLLLIGETTSFSNK